MKAVVCTAYGPPEVLRLQDLPKPVPKDDEVLIRIRATTVSAADRELRSFDFAPWLWVPIRLAFGIRRPRRLVLGQDLAGDVESVGKTVRSFEAGDRVFAATGIGLGGYAEYICLRETPKTGAITRMPANLSYEEAAAVPYGGGEALEFMRKADVRRGHRVLVNGAGGSFGTYAVQLAKDLGAHVTAVDAAPKLEMLRTLGADRVIDYATEDFTDGPETYDVIFDVVRGTPSGRMVKSLTENGWLLMANPGFGQIVRARWASRRTGKRVSFAASGPTSEDSPTFEDLGRRRDGCARSSTGASRSTRSWRPTGMSTAGRSPGTSSSSSRSRRCDRGGAPPLSPSPGRRQAQPMTLRSTTRRPAAIRSNPNTDRSSVDVAAVDDQLRDRPTDRRRVLEPVAAEPVGEQQVARSPGAGRGSRCGRRCSPRSSPPRRS